MASKSINNKLTQWWQRTYVPELIICLLAFTVYANTLGHEFTQDDAIVIYDNDYTQQGISGIKDIFGNDTFSGFFKEEGKEKLVAGGRYRPMTLAAFAVIWQFFGNTPWVFHLFVVLNYVLLCLVFYWVIRMFDFKNSQTSITFALLASIVYAVHPIHTEVVANVKGLDETWSLLWSLLALLSAWKYQKRGAIISLIGSSICMWVALLSKESALPWILLIPVILWFFNAKPQKNRIVTVALCLGATLIGYLLIRGVIIGWSFGEPPMEMMNNPFIKVVDGQYLPFTTGEKWASIIYGLGKYLQLLFMPHPLTHDYYPRSFGVVSLGDPAVLMAVLMHAMMIGIGILGIAKRSFVSFCIFLFYATIGLTSNIVFPIGTHLSERFLFAPSLSYALLGSYVSYKLSKWGYQWSVYLILFISLAFGARTIIRNTAWKSDYTLFTTDVHTSGNSAKVRNAAGGAMIQRSTTLADGSEKTQLLQGALVHLQEAITIHPRYKNAHLLQGNAHTYLTQYDDAIVSYDNALKLDIYYEDAEKNLLLALVEGARQAGSKRQDFATAINYLNRAIVLSPQSYEANSLLGIAHGSNGNHKEAINYFIKSIEINPNNARAYVNLGYAQLNMGLEDDAQINFNKAVQIDPKALDRNE